MGTANSRSVKTIKANLIAATSGARELAAQSVSDTLPKDGNMFAFDEFAEECTRKAAAVLQEAEERDKSKPDNNVRALMEPILNLLSALLL